ncbi:twin-arginine translocation pathway signal protein [uncultured Hoeflea sp.]|mgnify:FL=1|uniref:Acg family FMN-binding oxidoreductase n=1 Tax=uncultured Hoeflea sp. TaxID=538666 RepID=UPI0030EC125A
MTSRRKFMAILGGGIIVAAGGIGTWSATRDPAGAREPWEAAKALAAETGGDPRIFALSHAILAPNPHNRQPWIAELSTPGEITLYFDTSRRLPETDPFDRQLTIGLGCFVELLAMAAAETGHRADVSLFPDGAPQPVLDERPVARIRLVADETVQRDPLFAQIFLRHTNREAYDMGRPINAATLDDIATAVRSARLDHATGPEQVAALRSLTWDAMETELRTYRTMKESVDLMRIGKAEIEANPDGISLGGPLNEGLELLGLMDRQAMLDPGSMVFAEGMKAQKVQFDTAMGFLWLATPGNARSDQIAAGRDYVRMHLAVTEAGLSLQPFSQALQEYEEMAGNYADMRSALRIGENETLQMLVRLGYGPEIKASPRWPLETRIRTA